MATTVARLQAVLSADTRDFDRAMGRSQTRLQRVGAAAGIAGAAIGGALVIGLRAGWKEMLAAQKVTAQTNAVLKSTGGVANVSAEAVDKLATSLMKKSGVDDETIKAGENMLLTFTRIHNEAGRGNDIFNQATRATLDLSVATGKDMQSSAILVGKALNDLIRGLTGLRRVGVQFTKAQEAQIKKMVESGDVMGAQKIILKELQTEFGGSAEAAGKTLAGQLDIAKESFKNLMATIVEAVLPAFTKFTEKMTEAIVWLQKHPKLAKAVVIVLGALAAALMAAWAAQLLLNLAVLANPYVLAAAAIAALVVGLVILWQKYEDLRLLIIAFVARFTPLGALILLIKDNFKTFKQYGLDPVVAVFKWFRDIGSTIFGAVKTATNTALDAMKTTFNALDTAIDKVVTGFKWARDVGAGIWTAVKEAAKPPIDAIKDAANLLDAALDKVKAGFAWARDNPVWGAIWAAVKTPLGKLKDAFDAIRDVLDDMKSAIKWLIEKIPTIPKPPGWGKSGWDIITGGGDESKRRPPPGEGIGPGRGDSRFSPKIWDEMAIAQSMGGTIGASSSGRSYGDHGKVPSHAIDVFGTAAQMSAFASAMYGRAGSKDVFYGPHPFWQDNGRMIQSWFGNQGLRDDHMDHVHYSVFDRGGWLRPGWTLAYNGTGAPERVGGGNVTINMPNYVGSKQEFLGWLKNAIAQDRRAGGLGFGV